jgi:hypothetical protein
MLRNRYVYRKEADENGDDTGGGKADEIVDVVDKNEGKDDVKDESQVSAEIIAKAEKMGWTPKDQFKGDPAKWRPADEFVERGENMLPLVKAQVKRQERQIAELTAGLKELGDFHSKAIKNTYARAMADLKAQRAAAIASGDGAAFDAVDEQIDTLKDSIKADEPKNKGVEGDDPVFAEWLTRNKWAEDKKLQSYGFAYAEELRASGSKAEGLELLELVTKEIKAKFPEKFENPRRAAAAAVESGAGPRRTGGKSYADLPAEARAACDRMAKNGYSDKPKEMAEFKAQYVKQFFEQE